MVVVSDRPFKRHRTNRVTADLYDFLDFPSTAASGGDVDGGGVPPFREAVKLFLSRHARLSSLSSSSPSLFPSLQTWRILFRVGDRAEEVLGTGAAAPAAVALDVVEEDVTRSSRSVYCNQCRVVGWSENPVCRKRYHFIIKSRGNSADGCRNSCKNCGNVLNMSESSCGRCNWCDTVVTGDDTEECVYSQLEDNTHLLHGVVHSNGFGHLLLVKGKEGGSKVLTGTDIMNFWDRLCTTLAVRKVSVMDVSRKYGMEYRLLNAVATGRPWYSNWGYMFGRGSYALTYDSYKKAVESLSCTPLAPFMFQGRRSRTRLQAVIAFYRSLSVTKLVTLKDLFSFMLSLIHESDVPLPPKATVRNSEFTIKIVLPGWTRDDVENVQQAMLKVLRAASHKTNRVTRQALKSALYKTASTELLDYCVQHLGGKVTTDGMVVQARFDPNSHDIEYRLEPPSVMHCRDKGQLNPPFREHIISDVKFLFESLLHPETMGSSISQATRENMIDSATKILDCKHFVKDYRSEKKIISDPFAIYLWCHIEFSDQFKAELTIPPEPIVLPANATLIDLKNEASKAFQEVYPMLKRFEVEELLGYGSLEDSMALKFLVGPGGSVRVKGTCTLRHGLHLFRKERGMENWIVDCLCGAKDDDGETMLACDTCGVWQHTRCADIENSDATLKKFECFKCISSHIKRPRIKPNVTKAPIRVSIHGKSSCGSEASGNGTVPGATRLTGI
ncbi:hypothetical protein Tsubulata_029623 [Turnera subulata]|uniref:Zinc finger PHD-type domain-containing protein n=1 Tax=Turnera subulata TaxID=218843 RepID=A0A9Q0FQ10_9ROSI|nr:hypothetical protein Tsubulata_029623 [Turnera subulata]